jgi:hypothetical protein
MEENAYQLDLFGSTTATAAVDNRHRHLLTRLAIQGLALATFGRMHRVLSTPEPVLAFVGGGSLSAGRRGDAVEYFMTKVVGLPPDTVRGPQPPRARRLLSVGDGLVAAHYEFTGVSSQPRASSPAFHRCALGCRSCR